MHNIAKTSALAILIIACSNVTAKCPTKLTEYFTCKLESEQVISLCGSKNLISEDPSAIDRGILQIRIVKNGKTSVVPELETNSAKEFKADRGGAKGAGAWWSDIWITDESRTYLLSAGVSDTQDKRIIFETTEKAPNPNRQTSSSCKDLSIDGDQGTKPVPGIFYRLVEALSRR